MLDTLFTGIWYTVDGKVTNYSALYYFYCTFIGDFDIFPLISQSDFVSINLLILILENICVTSNTLWLIKTMMLVLKVSTYVNTSITAPPIGLNVMQVIMSVSTFKTDIILFVVGFCLHNVAWKCLTKSKSICIFWNLRVIITYIWILIDIGFGNCCQATRACCCCC